MSATTEESITGNLKPVHILHDARRISLKVKVGKEDKDCGQVKEAIDDDYDRWSGSETCTIVLSIPFIEQKLDATTTVGEYFE